MSKVIYFAALCLFLLFFASCAAGTARPSAVQQNPSAHLLYVAIGASDTFGLGADDPRTENWAADLARELGPGTRLINLGIPGITLHQALNLELPVALDTRPNLITIWLAVNDIGNYVTPGSYAHDLEILLNRLQTADPHARIAIANVPDLHLLPYFEERYDYGYIASQIQAYNAIIASAASRHHLLLIDLYSQRQTLSEHPEYISDDGFHPSTIGYQQIANQFYQTLKQAR
jgi:lysophospholipase L1-like esterase